MSKTSLFRTCRAGLVSAIVLGIFTLAPRAVLAADSKGGSHDHGGHSGASHGGHDHGRSHTRSAPAPATEDDSFYTVAAIRQVPNAQLFLTGASMSDLGPCSTLVNQSTRTVRRIVLWSTVIDETGKESSGGSSEERGTFLPGKPAAGDCGYGRAPYGDSSANYVVTPIEIDYTDGTAWNAGPDLVGQSLPSGDPDAAITRTYAWAPEGECVDLAATGARTITHVQVMFSHTGSDGAVVADDAFDFKGTIAPGGVSQLACRTNWKGIVTPDVGSAPSAAGGAILYDKKPTTLAARVTHVDFADGTSWSAPATTAPAVASPPTIAYDTWWTGAPGLPLEVARQATSSIIFTDTDSWLGDPCADFVTNSTLGTTLVKLTFSHTASDGTDLGSTIVDVKGGKNGFPSGSKHEICSGDNVNRKGPLTVPIGWNAPAPSGTTFAIGGLQLVMPVQWSGGNIPFQAFFNGKPVAKTGISVLEVDYADGTAWRAS